MKIAHEIKDIIKLTKEGAPDTMIALAMSKLYEITIPVEYVKAIRSRFFNYDLANKCYVDVKTGTKYFQTNILDNQCLKLLGYKGTAL